MFGIGAGELIVLLALALIIVGPQKLPEIGRSLGNAIGQFKAQSEELKSAISFDTSPAKSSSTVSPNTSAAVSHFPGLSTGYGSAVERMNRQDASEPEAELELVGPDGEAIEKVETNDNLTKEI